MDEYLSPAQVCERIPGMNLQLLANMRYQGTGPKFIKPSPKKVVYAASSIDEYMRSRERTSTAEPIPA